MAKVDVVIPCYNYGRFLEACVRSVLDQSLKDVRVLIIDDASPDDTAVVAQRLARSDPRVSVISHARNIGHIATYNEGIIGWSASDYILLLSADDMMAPGALERACQVMDANPDIVLTFGDCIDWSDDQPLPTVAPQPAFRWVRCDLIAEICASATNFVRTPTAIGRTSIQKMMGGYRADLPHSGDLEMWLRFAAHGAVARIGAVQAIYRSHASAMSRSYFADCKALLPDFRQRKLAFDIFLEGTALRGSGSLRNEVNRALAREAFENSIRCLRRGEVRIALELAAWAIKADPSMKYITAIRGLFRLPGPEGRERLLSFMRDAGRRLAGRA